MRGGEMSSRIKGRCKGTSKPNSRAPTHVALDLPFTLFSEVRLTVQ